MDGYKARKCTEYRIGSIAHQSLFIYSFTWWTCRLNQILPQWHATGLVAVIILLYGGTLTQTGVTWYRWHCCYTRDSRYYRLYILIIVCMHGVLVSLQSGAVMAVVSAALLVFNHILMLPSIPSFSPLYPIPTTWVRWVFFCYSSSQAFSNLGFDH